MNSKSKQPIIQQGEPDKFELWGQAIFFIIFIVAPIAYSVWHEVIAPEPPVAQQYFVEEPGSFRGEPCLTPECGGHEAGYKWARENRITSPDGCGGKSKSFIAGCKSYADEYWDVTHPEQ